MAVNHLLLSILSVAYVFLAGVINIVAYLPTIKDLYHHKKASANVHSYWLWTLTGAITLLYSLFILPDLLFIIVSLLNFLACIIVLCARITLKEHHL